MEPFYSSCAGPKSASLSSHSGGNASGLGALGASIGVWRGGQRPAARPQRKGALLSGVRNRQRGFAEAVHVHHETDQRCARLRIEFELFYLQGVDCEDVVMGS